MFPILSVMTNSECNVRGGGVIEQEEGRVKLSENCKK